MRKSSLSIAWGEQGAPPKQRTGEARLLAILQYSSFPKTKLPSRLLSYPFYQKGIIWTLIRKLLLMLLKQQKTQ